MESATQQQLIDLSYLTEEEREKLVAVIKADEELRVRDRIRLGTIRQEIERQRSHQIELDRAPQCSSCERRLGRFFNSGAHCPRCGHRVCKRCRLLQTPPPPKFICSVCERQRLLDLQSNDYNIGTALSVPRRLPDGHHHSRSPTPQRLQKQSEERDNLYGSELLRKSLMAASSHANSCSSSPAPERKSLVGVSLPQSHASVTGSITGSVASSIVVRYADRDDSEDERSLGDEDEGTVQPAKKITLEELPEIEEDDDEQEEKEKGKMDFGRKYVAGQSLGSSLVPSGSIGSITSMYSASVGKGDYDITGEVEIGVWFKDRQLFVRVMRARGLAAAKKGGVSDPYVKTYLLPDRGKRSKRKTGVQRKTVNPVFNEILKTKIEQEELSSRTLWLSVWDWDRFGRNQFLGELRLPLSSLNLTDSKERWYQLEDKDETSVHDDFYKGKLRVGLMYSPKTRIKSSSKNTTRTIGTLHVAIHQAEDLPIMDEHGLTDATVKMYLLPNQSSSSKRKTKVVKNSLTPVWNEQFTYENICLEDLTSGRVLEVTVWDYDRRGSNDFIGGLRIGPHPDPVPQHKHKDWMDSVGDEVVQWEAMLERPGEWVERWHVLRPSMESLSKYRVPSSPAQPRMKKELSPVQELSPTHELEESGTLPVVEGFSFSLPPTPKRFDDTQLSVEAFKQATPVAAEELLFNDEEEEEEEEEWEKGRRKKREEIGGGIVPASTHEFVVDERKGSVKEATSQSREVSPIPEVVVTPEPEQKISIEKLKDQFGSTTSLYNEGDYDITGEVLVGVYYKNKQLHVHIDRARGLAAADSNGYSDPYVKTYLLPDKAKHTKQKTSVKKKTLDPVYNEILKYKYSESELSARTLWLSVWDWDRFGKNRFLGEVHLPLSSLDLQDNTDYWYHLKDKSEGSPPALRSSSVKSVKQPKTKEKSRQKQKSVPKNEPPLTASASAMPPSVTGKEALQHESSHVASPLAKEPSHVTSPLAKEPSHAASPLAKEPAVSEERVTKHESKYEPPSPVASSSSSVPEVSAVKTKDDEYQIEEIHSPLQTAALASVVSSSASENKGDFLVETRSRLKSKGESSTETIAESSQTVEHTAAEPKISLTEIHQDYQGQPQKHPSPLTRLKHEDRSSVTGSISSFGSMTSIYSEAGGKGDYDITGEVLVGVYYKSNQLHVHVDRARGLAAADSNGYSDPYVKTYLLPDKAKHTKQKTSVKKKTLDPVYNEILKYKLSKSELSSRTLWLSVWDWDRFGRNQFLGELHLPLSSLDLSVSTSQWYQLQDKDESVAGGVDAFYRGQVKLALKFLPSSGSKTNGTLAVDIREAKELPAMDGDSTDAAVKLHLLPNRKSSGKRKTGVIKHNLNPVWEEKFTYEDISHEDLSRERVLEVSVWNYSKSGNTFIGGLRLGPAPGSAAKHKDWMDSIGDEVTQWEDMLSRPGEWVEQWHTLRTTLNPRHVDLQTSVPHPPPISRSSPPRPTTTTHRLPLEEKTTMSSSPVVLADEFKKTSSPTKRSSVAKKDKELEVEDPVTAEQCHPTEDPLTVPVSTFIESTVASETAKHQPLPMSSEFKKMPAPSAAKEKKEKVGDVHEALELQQSQKDSSKSQKPAATVGSQILSTSSESPAKTSTTLSELRDTVTEATVSKPVFSASVRTRPVLSPIHATTPTDDGGKIRGNSPSDKSGVSHDQRTPSPTLDRRTDKEEAPVITVEGERTLPKATSTPVVAKSLNLSEVGAYMQESTGIDEAHIGQATPPRPRVPGLLGLKQAGSVTSFGSMTSIYSEAGGKGDYDITGEVLVGVYYKSNQLHVHVDRARGLAAADSNGYSDPYVKTYLLPDKAKHTKQKTSVKKKTLDPVYNEILKYKYSESELSSRTLWLSVWDWDRFGRNLFLGEVRLPLSSLDLTDTTDSWYPLQDKDEESSKDETYKGQLKISINFSPEAHSKKSKGQGALHIAVEQAKDLQEPVDSFVKLYLLPDKSSSGKRKTKIIKSSLKPAWEEKFVYEKVKLDELSNERVLEITMWNFHKRSGNVFIGGLRLGPAPGSAAKHKDWMDSIGDEVTQWEDMLARPGEWVEQWHTLRTTMNPRDILLH